MKAAMLFCFLTCITSTGFSHPFDLSNGLVAYYPFNGNTQDESGNGNHGVINGGVTFVADRFGNANSACSFNGTNGYINVANGAAFNFQDFTISVFIKPNSSTTYWSGIIDRSHSASNPGNTGDGKNWVIQRNQNTNSFYLYYNSTPSGQASTPFTVNYKAWNHLIVIKSGTNIKVYRDGNLVVNENKATANVNYTNLPLLIGAVANESRYFDGLIDDIRIYNRAITDNEVTTLLNKENGLVAYYPFNGNTLDESGNGNDGVINGGVTFTADRFGNANTACSFNGTNGYINVANGQAFAFQNFTISVFIKPAPSSTPYEGIIDRSHAASNPGNGTGKNWVIQRNIAQNSFYLYYNSTVFQESSPFPVNYSAWNHLIIIKNGTNIKVYRDGALVVNENKSSAIINYTNLPLIIGGVANAGRFFTGLIDDISIYNRALTDNEVNALICKGSNCGLVAHYPFNGTTRDESGNGNHGVINGGVTFVADRFGNANSACSFNGTDGYINVPNGSAFNFQDFTISVFIKPNTNATYYSGIIDRSHSTANPGNTGDGKNWVIQRNLNQNSFYLYYNSTPAGQASTPFAVNYNAWNHLIIIKNGATIKVYRDGNLVVNENKATANINYTNLPLLIGAVANEYRYFDGLIDDIKIYGRALAEDEVINLIQQESLPYTYSPETVGKWSAPLTSANNSWPFEVALHMNNLPNGRILLWGRGGYQATQTTTYTWSPYSGHVESTIQNTYSHIFCSDHTILPNGKVIVASGHDVRDVPDGGIKDVNIFDPANNSWSRVTDLNCKRWYPTSIVLPNGNVLTVSGTDDQAGITHSPNTHGVATTEVYNYATNTWSSLSLNTAPNWYDYFPFMYVAPNGSIFNAGAARETKFLTISGSNGTFSNSINRYYNTVRDYGTAVMTGSKVMVLGGGQENQDVDPLYINNRPDQSLTLSSNTAEVIDLANSSPSWSPVASLTNRRRHANSVTLPDGTVLVTGGTQWFHYNAGSEEESVGWTDFSSNRMGTTSTRATEVSYTAFADGRLELYIIDQNRNIYRSEQTSINGAWSAFQLVGTTSNLAIGIAAKRHEDGSADVIMLGIDNVVWLNHYDVAINSWSGFNTMVGPAGSYAKRVALTSYADKRLDVYIIDFSNNVCRSEQAVVNGSFPQFQVLGNLSDYALDIAAIRHRDGSADVALVRPDNNNMWHNHYDAATNSWTGFNTLIGNPGNKAQRISICAYNDNRLDFYMIGMDGNMWHIEQNAVNGPWQSFQLVGNYGNKGVAISTVRRPDNYCDVAFAGLDNVVWRAWDFGPVYQAELYNPDSNTWLPMASMSIPRMYHSTSLLLPDARVITAGSGKGGGGGGSASHYDAQIFYPPYLFKGPQPVITAAPATINYAIGFTVNYNSTSQISKVSLVALGSVTHSYNTSQRYVPLSFSGSSGTLTITSPANANIAPPGYYMLFVINANGVPSIAKMVQLFDVNNPPAALIAFNENTGSRFKLDTALPKPNNDLSLVSNNQYVSIFCTRDNSKVLVATEQGIQSNDLKILVRDDQSRIVLKKAFDPGICKGGKGKKCVCAASTELALNKLPAGTYSINVMSSKGSVITTTFKR